MLENTAEHVDPILQETELVFGVSEAFRTWLYLLADRENKKCCASYRGRR
jgi:hypothetical protein